MSTYHFSPTGTDKPYTLYIYSFISMSTLVQAFCHVLLLMAFLLLHRASSTPFVSSNLGYIVKCPHFFKCHFLSVVSWAQNFLEAPTAPCGQSVVFCLAVKIPSALAHSPLLVVALFTFLTSDRFGNGWGLIAFLQASQMYLNSCFQVVNEPFYL